MKKTNAVKNLSVILLTVMLLFQLSSCFQSKNFEPGRVIILLTPEESTKMITYTPDDFSNVGCIEIDDISSSDNANEANFRRTLVLYIEDNSAAGVQHAAEILRQYEWIESATPDSFVSID